MDICTVLRSPCFLLFTIRFPLAGESPVCFSSDGVESPRRLTLHESQTHQCYETFSLFRRRASYRNGRILVLPASRDRAVLPDVHPAIRRATGRRRTTGEDRPLQSIGSRAGRPRQTRRISSRTPGEINGQPGKSLRALRKNSRHLGAATKTIPSLSGFA